GARARLRPLRRHDHPARRGRPHPHRPVGSRHGPARVGGPAPGRLLPRLPQPPRDGDRPARAAGQPHRGDRARGGRAVRHPPRGVLPRAHARVGRAARRHRRPDRGQELDRPARADRPRHRRVLRPGLEGHADPRAQQPHAAAHPALRRAADRPALLHDARRAREAALRVRGPRLPLPGPGGGHGEPLQAV
ncbi:MAG: Deoxycytidine triphosphate deaminase, partial [uncultured Solirubrobacteraceae bacterium]